MKHIEVSFVALLILIQTQLAFAVKKAPKEGLNCPTIMADLALNLERIATLSKDGNRLSDEAAVPIKAKVIEREGARKPVTSGARPVVIRSLGASELKDKLSSITPEGWIVDGGAYGFVYFKKITFGPSNYIYSVSMDEIQKNIDGSSGNAEAAKMGLASSLNAQDAAVEAQRNSYRSESTSQWQQDEAPSWVALTKTDPVLGSNEPPPYQGNVDSGTVRSLFSYLPMLVKIEEVSDGSIKMAIYENQDPTLSRNDTEGRQVGKTFTLSSSEAKKVLGLLDGIRQMGNNSNFNREEHLRYKRLIEKAKGLVELASGAKWAEERVMAGPIGNLQFALKTIYQNASRRREFNVTSYDGNVFNISFKEDDFHVFVRDVTRNWDHFSLTDEEARQIVERVRNQDIQGADAYLQNILRTKFSDIHTHLPAPSFSQYGEDTSTVEYRMKEVTGRANTSEIQSIVSSPYAWEYLSQKAGGADNVSLLENALGTAGRGTSRRGYFLEEKKADGTFEIGIRGYYPNSGTHYKYEDYFIISEQQARAIVSLSQGRDPRATGKYIDALLVLQDPNINPQFPTRGLTDGWGILTKPAYYERVKPGDAAGIRATLAQGNSYRPPAEKLNPKTSRPNPPTYSQAYRPVAQPTQVKAPQAVFREDNENFVVHVPVSKTIDAIHRARQQDFLVGPFKVGAGLFNKINTPTGAIIESFDGGNIARLPIDATADGNNSSRVTSNGTFAATIVSDIHKFGTNVRDGVLKNLKP